MASDVTTLDANEDVIPIRTIRRAIVTGLLLTALGFTLFSIWGGLDELQRASTPAEFATAAEHGNQVRWASWADILLFVPGYVLLLCGILAIFVRTASTPLAVRTAAIIGTVAAIAGGLADEIENALVQLGLGTVDLGADNAVVAPRDGLITALNAATTAKYVFGIVAVAVVVGLAANALLARRRHDSYRSTEDR